MSTVSVKIEYSLPEQEVVSSSHSRVIQKTRENVMQIILSA